MGDLPGPGIEPESPALAGRFLTTGPPGKSCQYFLVWFPRPQLDTSVPFWLHLHSSPFKPTCLHFSAYVPSFLSLMSLLIWFCAYFHLDHPTIFLQFLLQSLLFFRIRIKCHFLLDTLKISSTGQDLSPSLSLARLLYFQATGALVFSYAWGAAFEELEQCLVSSRSLPKFIGLGWMITGELVVQCDEKWSIVGVILSKKPEKIDIQI